MPRRRSEYLSGRGFSMFVDLKDAIPDIYEELPRASVDAVKKVAEQARVENEGLTPMKTGRLRNNTDIVGYVNGSLGGTVYVRWLATNPKDGYRYAYPQEMGRGEGKASDRYYVNYTTPGTGPGFMKATHDTIKQNIVGATADGIQELIKSNGV